MPKMAATDRVDDGGTGGRLGTSGSSLPVVQPGPQYRKVVHPCGSQRGSQPEPRRALLVVFKSVPGFRPVIVSICLFGLGDGPHSKIIPHDIPRLGCRCQLSSVDGVVAVPCLDTLRTKVLRGSHSARFRSGSRDHRFVFRAHDHRHLCNHRPGTDQMKPRPVGEYPQTIAHLRKHECPRQDSNLRHRL